MFKGIITPILTLFNRDENQSINYVETEKLINNLIDKGVNGIFALGSNGEFHVLSFDEKIEFLKFVVKVVDKRVPVFAGTGACFTDEAIALSRKMEEIGVDAISVLCPYFIQPTQEEIFLYFEQIAESVEIPVVVYNIPRLTGVNIEPSTVGRLVKIDNVKAVKDSSRNLENLQGYIDACKDTDVNVWVGSDSIIYTGYMMGASGAIAGLSNVIPDVIVGLYDALSKGDDERAKYLQDEIKVLGTVNKKATMPAVLKRSLELSGLINAGPARRPGIEVSQELDEEILSMLDHYEMR